MLHNFSSNWALFLVSVIVGHVCLADDWETSFRDFRLTALCELDGVQTPNPNH